LKPLTNYTYFRDVADFSSYSSRSEIWPFIANRANLAKFLVGLADFSTGALMLAICS